jgi:Fic-DOC domain mobile mystery protein B
MGLNTVYKEEGTILTDDEREGLKIKTIISRDDLNQFEQKNIEQASDWLLRKKISLPLLLSIKFINDLHYQMLGQVWVWAGKYRKSNKNIGVDKTQVSSEIKKLLDDCQYWIDNKTFTPEEIAIRFSHRLVWIHPFANGNGRLSRLLADIMMERIFKKPRFSWSFSRSGLRASWRADYHQALVEADNYKYERLLNFAKRD